MAFVRLILHPVSLVVYQGAALVSVLSFTTSSSIIRAAVFPLSLYAAWLLSVTCFDFSQKPGWNIFVVGQGHAFLLRYLDMALLSRWSYESGGPTRFPGAKDREWRKELDNDIGSGSKSKGGVDRITDNSRGPLPLGETWKRLRFGLRVSASSRYVDTAYEVKNVPHFSASDSSYVPSSGLFLRQTAMVVALCYIFIDISSLGAEPEKIAGLFSPEDVPFFMRVGAISAKHVAIRIASSLSMYIIAFCYLRMGYGILAMVAVSTKLSEVSGWRPPFGRLEDAYTVRHFWGTTWHQKLRQPFSSPANFWVDNVLRLTDYPLIARYSKIFGTFLTSGLMHMAVDVSTGMSASESGSVRFFCTQALGIMLEDAVQAIYRSTRGQDNGRGCSQSTKWTRALGYVWVVVFLSWSTPAWAYPAIRRNRGEEDLILPISIVRLLL